MAANVTINNVYDILEKILGLYTLLLIVIGTITSLLSIYICFRLRQTSTFVFLAFLSLSDILTLYYWNLTHFINSYTNIDFLNFNYWVCKFGSYFQFTSLQISAWLLVNHKIEKVVKLIYF